MNNILQIIAALQQIVTLLGPFSAVAIAAEQAYLKGGWAGLVIYLETLFANPPPGPVLPVAALKAAVASLKTAHA